MEFTGWLITPAPAAVTRGIYNLRKISPVGAEAPSTDFAVINLLTWFTWLMIYMMYVIYVM